MKACDHAVILRRCVLLLFVGVVCANSFCQPTDKKAVQPRLFTVSMTNITPLQGLARFGTENHVPIGIVAESPSGLCRPLRNIDLANAPVERVLDALIPGPDYVWSNEGGVFVIKPRTVPESSQFLLQLRFDRFGTMKTTFQGLGLILALRIRGLLQSSTGIAGDILSSTNAEEVNPMILENVTVEEVANRIVLQASKGLWILYPVPTESQQIGDVQQIYTYGYADDAETLSNLPCPNAKDTGAPNDQE